MPFQAERENDLLHLAAVVFLAREEQVFHNLLGNGARSLHRMSGTPVGHESPHDRERIHTPVIVEVGILGREKRLLDHHRDTGEW